MTEPTWSAKPRLLTVWPFVKESLLTVMLDQRVLFSGNTCELHKVSSSPVGKKKLNEKVCSHQSRWTWYRRRAGLCSKKKKKYKVYRLERLALEGRIKGNFSSILSIIPTNFKSS